MIYLIVSLLAGLILSKEFRRGIVTAIASAIVFTPVIAIGIIYNVFYPFIMAFKERSVKTFFRIIWRLIDGTYATIGNLIFDGFSIKWDEMGNVWGEWLEDSMTPEEQTTFGDKNTTISASVGFLEYENIKMFKRGKTLSKLLNIAFREKQHAKGSWLKKLAIKEIDEQNLKGKL